MSALCDRGIIVTGAAQGIGAETVRLLGELGARVAVVDRDGDQASRVAESVVASGGWARSYAADVRSRDDWCAITNDFSQAAGAVWGLVNNAGITRDRSVLKMSDTEWDDVVDTNLRACWIGCQTVIPLMMDSGGSIVNISSNSRNGAFGQANYAASKAGVVGLTRTVAMEHGRHGIRCNAVAPGAVATDMTAAVSEDVRRAWIPTIPLRRFGEPREIAECVAFLLSPVSSYVSGHVLCADGGAP